MVLRSFKNLLIMCPHFDMYLKYKIIFIVNVYLRVLFLSLHIILHPNFETFARMNNIFLIEHTLYKNTLKSINTHTMLVLHHTVSKWCGFV